MQHKKFQAHFLRKFVEVPPIKLIFAEDQRIIFQRKPRRAEVFSLYSTIYPFYKYRTFTIISQITAYCGSL